MMTSSQIRQSFLDFFKSKQHTLVPSSSLMPDSPNLLFTNAGMNQFVPIFLGERKADVSKWAGAIPSLDTRAADTQKCIRAGGKHNDLDDVGLDTYHHTFFEMLGNWSFGDYFKKEAIAWAWELVVEVWNFPPERIYTTVFNPQLGHERWEQSWKAELDLAIEEAKKIVAGETDSFTPVGDDSFKANAFAYSDYEAACYWAVFFLRRGLDPYVHIVPGNKKDNFWMMGETGPCGPCTEIHVDLRPGPRETSVEEQKVGATLVNGSDARCIEIWNNVFIQYNANANGSFSPLPAKHVDTGMGFERVTSIIQGTKGLTDFQNAKISNYETDIFRPIFDEIEKLSGKKYGSTLPKAGSTGDTAQEKEDVAFRVIADHIRTLSFSIADGIQPGNNDRNYVLRRILRRAVRYGRTLGFKEPFLFKLVGVLEKTMGSVFPELRDWKRSIETTIRTEEEAFNRTLDRGIDLFDQVCTKLWVDSIAAPPEGRQLSSLVLDTENKSFSFGWKATEWDKQQKEKHSVFPSEDAFKLYDTYGFPIDLTELMAREKGLTVDKEGFKALMEEQKTRARAAQKKQVIELSQIETKTPTHFLGYDHNHTGADVQEVVQLKDKTVVVLNNSVCYAEMGGQVGDTGELLVAADVRRWTDAPDASASSPRRLRIVNTQKSGNTILHFIEGDDAPEIGSHVTVQFDLARRAAIQRHHTVTHLLHWALHEVASKEASQKGSSVTPEKLTFDFNSAPLTPAQVADIEKLVNERILENAGVSWTEVPHADVKNRKDVMQFFGDKYGDVVRVVQIGGKSHALDGYSMELCGGTHTRATGEIGLFRIVSEAAVSAGVRRIEAVAGLSAYASAKHDLEFLHRIAAKIGSPIIDLEKKLDGLLAQQKELERQLKTAIARNASNAASELLGRVQTVNGVPLITHNLGDTDGDFLQAVVDALKSRFQGVIVLGGGSDVSVALVAAVTPEFTKQAQAGKLIQAIAPIVGGKGGGKPDNARGGGKDVAKLDEALAKVRTLL